MKMKKCLALAAICATLTLPLVASENFTPPASPRLTFNFNPGWKFFKSDGTNAAEAAQNCPTVPAIGGVCAQDYKFGSAAHAGNCAARIKV